MQSPSIQTDSQSFFTKHFRTRIMVIEFLQRLFGVLPQLFCGVAKTFASKWQKCQCGDNAIFHAVTYSRPVDSVKLTSRTVFDSKRC